MMKTIALIMFLVSVGLIASEIDIGVKQDVCLGKAVSAAMASLGQNSPQVSDISIVKDESLKKNQSKYSIMLTELNKGDYYRYLVTMDVSSRPWLCRVVKLESLP